MSVKLSSSMFYSRGLRPCETKSKIMSALDNPFILIEHAIRIRKKSLLQFLLLPAVLHMHLT